MKTTQALRSSAAIFLFLALSLFTASAQTELIVNGGFESGNSSWVVSGGADVYTTAGYAHAGTGFLWLGGLENEVDAAYQTVSVPTSATNATLSFYYYINSADDPATIYDTLTMTVQTNSGTVLATVGNWSNTEGDAGIGPSFYHQQTFDMLPYKGMTVRIHFASSNDSSAVTSFFIDDVSLQINAPRPPPPANDTCAGAIAMTAGTTYSLNTAAATSTGDPTPSCQGSFGKGVWYTYTPSASGTVTISTCGSSFDTALAVYGGSCDSLTPLACNDNNGPACASSQASLTFSATANITCYIMAGGVAGASGTLNILASGPGGLRIVPTFDSSITSDPNAATIEATINAAVAFYGNNFSDLTTVTITFQKMSGGLGQSSTYINSFSYANYRAALISHATTSDDATAVSHLPSGASNPVNGNFNLNITLPLARTLGFSANPPAGQNDATIYLNTSIMNLSLSSTNPTKYSLYTTVCHEMDEVLGLTSALNGLTNGAPAPTGPANPADLFRYNGSGTRSFNTASNTVAYFSLDGTNNLARFNQHEDGDFQDWYSYYGGVTPEVQDAYTPPGVQPVPNVELTVLDVLGYTRVDTLPPTNDTCSGAIAMTAGTTYSLNTALATSTGDPTPSCQSSFGKGVWYSYTPSASGTITISTCGSTFDTALAIYTGSCGSLTPLACNDNNGPACAGSQASLTFFGTDGTTYLIMAGGVGGASGALNILASGPIGLKIIPTFDSSIASDPNATTIEATINAAIAVYQNNFSDLTAVTITFLEVTNGIGESSTYYNTFSYANYRAALVSHATTADDATALAHLPNTVTNPVNGNSSLNIHLPLARTLGFSADPPAGQTDGMIYLNTSIMNLSLSSTNPSMYSLYATVCHEIDNVLGLSSALDGLTNGAPAPTGPADPEDLFRYEAWDYVTRSFSTDPNADAFFSLDGIWKDVDDLNDLKNVAFFNQFDQFDVFVDGVYQSYHGYFHDWQGYTQNSFNASRVQDAYATPGRQPVPNVELTVLDVLGYTRVGPPRPTLSLLHSGNNVVLAWPSGYTGFTLQKAGNLLAASWSTVTNTPAIVNSQYTVTNAMTGTNKYYRLIK